MALRSLGSSLIAKAQPGSISRKQTETRIMKPDIPGKGAVGTATRSLVEEPFIKPVAPGSEKVIAALPESTAVSQASLQPASPLPGQPDLLPGIMGQAPASTPQAPSRPGADNQALFASMPSAPQAPSISAPSAPSAASSTGKAGKTATATSSGSVLGAKAAAAYQPKPEPSAAPTAVQAPNYNVTSFWEGLPTLGNLLGSRTAAAGEGAINAPRNISQAVANQAANIVQNVSPQAAATLRSYANNPQVTNKGVGSITKPTMGALTNFANNPGATLRSVAQAAAPVVNNVRSTVSNVANNLRSALSKFNPFGRR